ncbi:MAG: helix-turn-helix transcriptional regulator [Bacteroidetes bacterium]|nr:helix-turn-helix transcriptional regulator [Bacteroidota bacterium]
MASDATGSPQLTRPADDIFHQRKSFLDCRNALEPYLQAMGPVLPLHERMDITLQLSRCEIEINNARKAEKLLEECEAYILERGSPEQLACVYNIKAHLYLLQTRHDDAIAAGLQSLHRFRQLDMPFYVMNSCVICGHTCAQMNMHTEAIDYLVEAQKIALKLEDRRQYIMCTMNLNDIRMLVLPEEESIVHAEELLTAIRERYADEPTYAEAGTRLQLAYLCLKSKRVDEARKYAERSMTVTLQVKHMPPHHLQYINLYAVMADIEAHENNEPGVLEYARQNRERAAQAGHNAAIVSSFFFLMRFYIKMGDLVKAKLLLDEGAALVPPDDDKSGLYLELHESYCEYYRAIHDSASELAHFRLVYECKMKTQQQALSNRVKYMATIHELERSRYELAQQRAELAQKNQELNMATYHLQRRDALLTELRAAIDEQVQRSPRAAEHFKKITHTIDLAFIREEDEKTRIREKFDETNKEYILRLHQLYPDLSPTESRICALLRSGFNTKEISSLLSTSIRNVENHRLRIRKKLELTKEDNLNIKLMQIVGS